jgi:hypothetical protein
MIHDIEFLEELIDEWYTLLVIYGSHSLMSKNEMAQACLDTSTATFIILRQHDRSSQLWRKARMLNETIIQMATTWNLGGLIYDNMKDSNKYLGMS